MPWWEVVGWVGSVLVVLSLMQARVWRFRVMNLVGAVLATAYNAVFGIWAFAAMNGAIAVIDVYWLWRLGRERGDEAVYAVVEVAPDDAYLRHVLAVHAADVARHRTVPAVGGDGAGPAGDGPGVDLAFLVVRGDETVGVVLVRDAGDGSGVVVLDWVTPRFRDFTPGEFVYRHSDVFAAHGLRRLVVPTTPPGAVRYLERVGFRQMDGRVWERPVDVR
ncbi:hypothetical protein J1G44_08945 [Cellulomonas sp. zg-ZUI199]|uniref:N-acetyltransferase domain-containing protein n=1 Tax=Cellulomonas wangleii TaxID=2816956 RepID=A0ABX8D553_9CELL|nr:hypothetical protein [Cellulomonas wangleii]MBO0924609.1 hypothetical protein [Cellulomonas wangleii]QVI62586.1 hypothetical protein KG103_01125 [Cellulomonas wangleii]